MLPTDRCRKLQGGIVGHHESSRARRAARGAAVARAVALRDAAARGELVVRFEVDEASAGGLAVYGEETGRYPLDPSVALTLRR